MTRIILKNPYFEEEIKVKETLSRIQDMLHYMETGNLQYLTLKQIEPTECMVTINPKNFAKVEFYEEEVSGFTTQTVSLLSLAKFKEKWYKLDRKFECRCKRYWCQDCDCDDYEEGYDLFPIRKVRQLQEGYTFEFKTPYTSEKYTHSVSSPSELS